MCQVGRLADAVDERKLGEFRALRSQATDARRVCINAYKYFELGGSDQCGDPRALEPLAELQLVVRFGAA